MARSGKSEARQSALRSLPSVDALLQRVQGDAALKGIPRARIVQAVREALVGERGRLVEGVKRAGAVTPLDADALARRVVAELSRAGAFSLAPVINATGVVLHTNLGRALLSPLALERLRRVGSAYSNLELDLKTKERGSRYVHVDGLLKRLTGAPASLVVNNNAAAVLLALESLARGKEVIVSRGELIEIGGEFRIPDIMRRSGAILREVGTTNRTHLKDYADAIGPETALLLKVHTSNYRVLGFTAQVPTRDLVELGRSRGIPVMEDLGSGCFVDLRPYGFPYEPTVQEAVAAGLDLVSFSGDKLLGGPQAGIVVGKAELVERLKKNPLNRALRIDKLTLAGLEATLYAYEAGNALETIPTLRMLTERLAAVRRRARRLLRRLSPPVAAALGAALVEGRAQVGGGSLPLVELPTVALAIGTPERSAQQLDQALREGEPPVIGRIADDRLLLDCRTVLNSDIPALADTLSRLAVP
ncbi:MAG: L-seryl-tRNA(Sec) selenium transferase, L-seryl-tRNA(Ser) seleniumtransferase [Candidatus Rokubacteria bacterium CSP1-6]|nr:MAG: L-seryl-tRNA(Sec) selenium transferase, L-seryl-tRNA(Ser) seleniumtransferase [Candidatus Rokubacteria bacterium CSP1-6]